MLEKGYLRGSKLLKSRFLFKTVAFNTNVSQNNWRKGVGKRILYYYGYCAPKTIRYLR